MILIVLRHGNDLPVDNSAIVLVRTISEISVNLLITPLHSIGLYIFKHFLMVA